MFYTPKITASRERRETIGASEVLSFGEGKFQDMECGRGRFLDFSEAFFLGFLGQNIIIDGPGQIVLDP